MKKYFQNKYKKIGVTLIELLIAMGISSIVMVSVLTTIGNIYFSQKKVRFSQNFYTESRILMERIAQFARNNTIDYDRYFLEVGPSSVGTDCDYFAEEQTTDSGSLPNTPESVGKTNRASLEGGYPSIFYWDTNSDGTQDRNLGGMNLDGNEDPCAQAFNGISQDVLYLINGARTLRTAIRNKNDYDIATESTDDAKEDYRIEIQRQLGADTDNDLVADIWGPYDADDDGGFTNYAQGDVNIIWNSGNSTCELHWDKDGDNFDETFSILGDKTSEDFCMKAHDWTSISPKLMKIESLTFQPGPDRDPFLNFRVDSVQVHPHVFISLKTDVRDPSAHGYENGKQPKLSFQTMVSSRVFGNTR